jgi:diguanylate cyclase (GGDEF)-like protein
MCAEGVQFEWDRALDQMAFFVRTEHGADLAEPDLICTLDAWLSCVAEGDRQRLETRLLELASNSTRSFEAQFRLAATDGKPPWIDLCALAVRDENGVLVRVIGHQRRLSVDAEHRSSQVPSPFHDPLTGLPNRLLFDRCLAGAVVVAGQKPTNRFAVLFIDLDGFKAINDAHGHRTGDRALMAVAQRFSHCVRPDDVLARRSGDEFTILLKDVAHEDDAATIAARILQQLESPLAFDGTELALSASIGVALGGHQPLTPEELLELADTAMYLAKSRGGNRYLVARKAERSAR